MAPPSDGGTRRWKKHTQSIGSTQFYAGFVKNYSDMVGQLRELLYYNVTPEAPFPEWKQVHEDAFQQVRDAFSSEPVIVRPNNSLRWVMMSDFSEHGVSAHLYQCKIKKEFDNTQNELLDEEGVIAVNNPEKYFDLQPIAFVSRALAKLERKYDPRQGEVLGILYGSEKLRFLLKGKPYLALTDHGTLEFLLSGRFNKTTHNRLSRWAIRLAEFQCRIKYRRGADNWSDPTFRYPAANDNDEEIEMPGEASTAAVATAMALSLRSLFFLLYLCLSPTSLPIVLLIDLIETLD